MGYPALTAGIPIGIPDPGFGIDDVMPSRPGTWTSEQAGYYFVNNDTGTDSGRTYGDPTAPRATIPSTIPAGSYIEIEGLYDTGDKQIAANGTSGSPVWITSAPASHDFRNGTLQFGGTYLFVDGLICTNEARISVSSAASVTTDHVVVRNCDITGHIDDSSATDSTLIYIGGSDTYPTTNVLFYNNELHDSGDINSSADLDAGGVNGGGTISNIWVLNNHIYNCAGNGVQFGHNADITKCHNIYVGKNHIHDCHQSGVWCKYVADYIVSQNHVYDNRPNAGANAMGIGAQHEPAGYWILYNRISGVEQGIKIGQTNGSGNAKVYIIGNLVEDCGWDATPHNGTTIWSEGSGIFVSGNAVAGTIERHIYNNIVYDCSHGISLAGYASGDGTAAVYNNIIKDMEGTNGRHLWTNVLDGVTTVGNNLFHQDGGTESIRWGTTNYTLATFKSSVSKCTTNCNVGDPVFTNTTTGNFKPTTLTYIEDMGTSLSALNTTLNTDFGTQLTDYDYDETTRIVSTIDIGAYEKAAAGGGGETGDIARINFIKTNSAADTNGSWTNVLPVTSTVNILNFADGVDTGWDLTPTSVSNAATTGVNAVGTGDADWVDEALVSDEMWWTGGDPRAFDITGLDNANTYTFEIFASKDDVPVRIGEYTIGATSVTLEGGGNSTNTVTIADVSPTAGTITFTMSVDTNFAYLNAILMTENVDEGAVPSEGILRATIQPTISPILESLLP